MTLGAPLRTKGWANILLSQTFENRAHLTTPKPLSSWSPKIETSSTSSGTVDAVLRKMLPTKEDIEDSDPCQAPPASSLIIWLGWLLVKLLSTQNTNLEPNFWSSGPAWPRWKTSDHRRTGWLRTMEWELAGSFFCCMFRLLRNKCPLGL